MKYLERVAEERIQEAVDRGEFDHLPLAGQKIEYQDYISSPVGTRLMFKLLKDANCIPAEVELLNEISKIREQLKTIELKPENRAKLHKLLNVKMIEREMRIGRKDS